MRIIGAVLKKSPVLLGVMWGALAYGLQWPLRVMVIGIVVFAVLLWLGDRLVTGRKLIAGLVLLEVSVLVAASPMAVATWAIVRLTVRLPAIFQGSEHGDVLAGVIAGAVTTFIASVLTTRLEDGDLWPTSRFKAALSKGFTDPPAPEKPYVPPHSVAQQVAFDDEVSYDGKKISGWELEARWERAWYLTRFLKSR